MLRNYCSRCGRFYPVEAVTQSEGVPHCEDVYKRQPLNTATGIVGRLEKRGIVLRVRSEEDKRVVTIQLSTKGMEQILAIINEIMYYGTKVLENFSQEELNLFFRMMDKLKICLLYTSRCV